MNFFFFPRIALSGIRNNSKLYYPYFCTCFTVVAIFYIMEYLTYDENLRALPYIGNAQQLTYLGCYVIALFSILFLLYTNSFLTKRRRKEFGLYNVLGMSKSNIAIVLFFETLFTLLLSLIFGLGFGILFSKFSQGFLIYLVKIDRVFDFEISLRGITKTLELFIAIFAVLYIVNVINVTKSKTIELVKSEQEGEKEPKANFILAILGLIMLSFAYYLATCVSDAVGAFTFFFVAVLLVICATYIIFITVSVVVCKLLKKSPKFYYQTNHFISTSSMTFRMKRNGAGLATICILSTMILVMISTTTCFYANVEEVIESKWKYDYDITYRFNKSSQLDDEVIDDLVNTVDEALFANNVGITNTASHQSICISGYVNDNKFEYDVNAVNDYDTFHVNNILAVFFVPLSDYNNLTGNNVKLNDNEGLIFRDNSDFNNSFLTISDDIKVNLVEPKSLGLSEKFIDNSLTGFVRTITIVVDNYYNYERKIINLYEDGLIEAEYNLRFNTNLSQKDQIDFRKKLSDRILSNPRFVYCDLTCRAIKTSDTYALYGSLFFLGITLSLVFGFATLLIIYYKQITEGYEDQSQFAIMKKVGITDSDIRKTINFQTISVFFMPLIFAIIHLAFATPMISKLMTLLGWNNPVSLTISCAVCSVLYSICYFILYKITSNTYYQIVNSQLSE